MTSDKEKTASADPIHLRVVDLKKAYGDQEVLRGVTLDVERGKINVIIELRVRARRC